MQTAGAAPAPKGAMQVLQLSRTKLEQWNREGQWVFAFSERDGVELEQGSSFHKVCTDCNVKMLLGRWIVHIFNYHINCHIFRGPKSSPERCVSPTSAVLGCSVSFLPWLLCASTACTRSSRDKLNLINCKTNDIENSSMGFFPVCSSLAILPAHT